MTYRIPALLLLFFAAVVQVSFGYALSVHGIRPGFVFIAVYALAINAGEGRGMLYGAAGGLILDCLSGGLAGLMLSSYAITGFLAGRLGSRVFNVGEAANFAGLLALGLVDGIYTAVVLGTFLGGYDMLAGILRYGLPQALYNAAAGAAILWFVDQENAGGRAWGGLMRRVRVRV